MSAEEHAADEAAEREEYERDCYEHRASADEIEAGMQQRLHRDHCA